LLVAKRQHRLELISRVLVHISKVGFDASARSNSLSTKKANQNPRLTKHIENSVRENGMPVSVMHGWEWDLTAYGR